MISKKEGNMLKIRHGMLIGLIAVIAAVAYANNSDNQPAPLGVVTKAEQKQPPAETPGTGAIVPAIPQEMPGNPAIVAQIPVRPTEADTATPAAAVSTEAEESKIVKTAKKTNEDSFPMPAADRKVVDRAVREATQRPLNAANSESKTVYAYTPDSIYTLYGAPGRVIDIQLQPGEKLSGPVIAGDTVRWVVGTTNSRNGAGAITHVLVKPIMAGIETNFIITTDSHSYHLIAKSLNRNFLPTVSWTYPHDEMAKFATYSQEGEGGVESLVTDGISPDKLNFKYKIDPDNEYPWTPVRVFDDGSKTYIQMSRNMKNTEAPVFFVKDKRGLNLVNYRVKGEYYIIDRLFDEGEFRCGKDDVVNIKKDKPWSLFGS
jgi:P-type conjugative transfer protein TrbG